MRDPEASSTLAECMNLDLEAGGIVFGMGVGKRAVIRVGVARARVRVVNFPNRETLRDPWFSREVY